MEKLHKLKKSTEKDSEMAGAREDLNIVGVPQMGGYGHDGFGLGGGLIGGLLLGALLRNGNGGVFGGNGDGGGAAVNQLTLSNIQSQLGDIKASVPLAESQVQLALAGAQADITSQSLQQTIALQNQGFNSQLATQAAFTQVGDKVDSLAAANALAIATNQFKCVQATMADGEKTRALITANQIADLNRLAQERWDEIVELRSEGRRTTDRHGIEINMLNNQNQNQMQFQQQAQVLGTLSNALAGVAQIAHATNQNLIVGNAGATTTGAQTANPVNVRT
jgi:hypothetical protein